MKNSRKLPSKQLEKFSSVFIQLGLVLVLFVVFVTLEHQTEQKPFADKFNDIEFNIPYVIDDDTKPIIFKKAEKPKPKIIKPPRVFNLDKVKKGNDDIIETKLPDDLNMDEDIEMIDLDSFQEVNVPEVIDDSEIPFILIEDAPIFKGCERLSKKENKICFEKKMRKFVQNNFDVALAQELGLRSGKYKIHAQFIIDNNGKIADVKIKAPHTSLKKETKRVVEKLPKFTPGMQRKKPVKVRYTLPIAFAVE